MRSQQGYYPSQVDNDSNPGLKSAVNHRSDIYHSLTTPNDNAARMHDYYLGYQNNNGRLTTRG